MVEPIEDSDLHAFIDARIEPLRRLDVLDHLANHPQLAAQVMADLRCNEELKLLYGAAHWKAAAKTVAAAHRLERGLVLQQLGFWSMRAAGIVLLLGIFYFAHLKAGVFEVADEPGEREFVADAVHAYRTQLLLAHIPAMANSTIYNAEDVRTATEIVMPNPLPGLQVTNVQVVPTHAKAAVDAMFKTQSDSRIALFAVHTSDEKTVPPTVSKSETETTVYWQQGRLLYALTGTDDAPLLQQMAANFSKESE